MALWKKISLWIVGLLFYFVTGAYVIKYIVARGNIYLLEDPYSMIVFVVLWPILLLATILEWLATIITRFLSII